jgi:predicted NBD/HSP70 family sugar kinase
MARPTGSIRHDDLRVRNRAQVLAATREARQVSRTELVGRTALSHSTISAIAGDLIAEGVLRERKAPEAATGRRGRPQVALEFAPTAALVVTAMLSLNGFSAALVDYAGKVVARSSTRVPTTTIDQDGLVGIVRDGVADLIESRPWQQTPVRRIALAIQGITDASARRLTWSPITSHVDIAFADQLEDAFGMPVTVENDCNMIAFALHSRDPMRYGDNFVAVLLSHGIGMGLMLRGDVFHGTRSSAGEFGHMTHQPNGALCRCGRRGCIEAYAGNYAIWRRAKGMSSQFMPAEAIEDSAMAILIDAARASDGAERQAFAEAGTALGYGLGSLFTLIDPAPVALVGIGATAFDLLEGAMRAALAQTAGGQHSETLSFAVEGDEMALTHEGCALHALRTIDQDEIATGSALPVPF